METGFFLIDLLMSDAVRARKSVVFFFLVPENNQAASKAPPAIPSPMATLRVVLISYNNQT